MYNVHPSSMPLVFRLVLLFFKDFSGLHRVCRTVIVQVDNQTGVKKRSHRRYTPGWQNEQSVILRFWCNFVISKNAPRSFWESRCTCFEQPAQNAVQTNKYLFCATQIWNDWSHLSSLICPSSLGWRSPKSGGTVVSNRTGLVLVFRPWIVFASNKGLHHFFV